MLHHTAQHLLNWAFEAEMVDRVPVNSTGASPTVPHGSQVMADRCLLRLTMFGEKEEVEAQLEGIVEGVESRCRSAIQAKLPVVTEQTAMETIAEVFPSFPFNHFSIRSFEA